MRGWAIGFLVLVLGLGVWMLEPFADDAPEIGEAVGGTGSEQPRPADAAPPGDLETRARTSIPDRPRDHAATRFTVPVELIAFVATSGKKPTTPIDHFAFLLTDANGTRMQSADAARSGHKLTLGVGSYVIQVSRAGRIAPGAARFTVTEGSLPISLRFPFRDPEAMVRLEVLDQTTKQRLEDFRLTIETHSADGSPPAVSFVPHADTNPVTIPAARGQKLVVKVEARDYSPAEPLTVAFDGSADRVDHRVFLAPSMKFAGVEFRVTDAAGRTIRNVSVRADKRQPDRTFQRLWSRKKGDKTGTYKLPDLAPGDYRIELRALDVNGEPTLHVPHAFEFQITGNEHILEPVVLAIGGTIELRLTDARGNAIGKDVSIELTYPDGKVHESLWRPLVDGKPNLTAALSADFLAKNGPARLEPAVPPGTYKIELSRADGPAVVDYVKVQAADVFTLRRQLSK